jgi:hypothetical protein
MPVMILPERLLITFVKKPSNPAVHSSFRALIRVCAKYPHLGANRFNKMMADCFKTPAEKKKAFFVLCHNRDLFNQIAAVVSHTEETLAAFAALIADPNIFPVLPALEANILPKFVDALWQHIFSSCSTAAALKKHANALVFGLPTHAITQRLTEFLENSSSKTFNTSFPAAKAKDAVASILPKK